jgi:hypothetical protein
MRKEKKRKEKKRKEKKRKEKKRKEKKRKDILHKASEASVSYVAEDLGGIVSRTRSIA